MSSLIVPQNLREGTFWVFLTTILLQKIKKKLKGKPLVTLENFRKNVCSEKKGASLVTTSAMRLAGTRGGGTNTMDIDPALINIAIAHFASRGLQFPRRGNRLKGCSPA